MKELSIKEKAKRYDEAVKVAKYYYDEGKTLEYANDIVSDIFPELKESEDEKTRKELYDFCMKCSKGGTLVNQQSDFQRWATWLEKQGEQNPNNNNQFTSEQADILDKHIDNFLGQKPAYKVEPKFKVGDWIVSNVSHEDYRICKILKIENGEYIIESIYGYQGHNNFETFDKDYHLWTIQDARDGDVLVCEDYAYTSYLLLKSFSDKTIEVHFWYNGQTNNLHNGTEVITREDARIHPATKEQRDLLFSKMKEAGYEWDADNKELKKIEQKPSTEMITPEESLGIDSVTYNKIVDECIYGKPVWSEEDERLCKCIIKDQEEALDDVRNDKYGHSEIISDLKDMYHERIDWLESLKDRIKPQWKPSDTQLDVLHDAAVYIDKSMFPYPKGVLMKIYKHLKKLKEE